MHEFSLVESMIGLVRESAAENGITRVSVVKLVVGRLVMAQPELLRFSFDVLKEKTVLEGASLEIEERPVMMRCRGCGNSLYPEYVEFICPSCGETLEVITGKELYIEHYEGDS
ncbi:MAG: hydrogenase maturation nickel metallochaperone HypA [Bacillota bacterium]